jgi:septal ring factor EnvC (AmiA/AmiB activator)
VKKKYIKILQTILISLLLIVVYETKADKKKIDKIRKEIQQLEMQLKVKEEREKTIIEQLEDINREIGFGKKLIQEVQIERKKQEKKCKQTEQKLQKAIKQVTSLKELITKRMVSMYKRGRVADWEALVSMNSLNKAIVWIKYQKLIMENDQRNLRFLKQKQSDVRRQKLKLERDVKLKNELIIEKKKQSDKLENKKGPRRKLLNQVQKDINSYIYQLRKKRQAEKEIIGRISMEEANRKESTESIDGRNFVIQKGNLPWPVKGKIISKYGRQKHPQLKTWTENLGIDIETTEDAAVRTVSDGEIRWVTWQRGMGNIVLIDNGGGYYTVYGHLDMVFVEIDDRIKQETIIGRVGDNDSLYGSVLHFEIWKGVKHYNPKTWLR